MPEPVFKNFGSLKIDQPFIALFGSGNSIHELSKQELSFIKSKAFVITINYAPVLLNGHLNMWSDLKVSDFLEEHYRNSPKDVQFLAQRHKVPKSFSSSIDYWFSPKEERLQGNYTIVWALQLLQKYFPDKIVLLFGIDMYAPANEEAKWYDRYTLFDKEKRGAQYAIEQKLDQCAGQIQKFCRQQNVYNCNLKSKLAFFEKRDWRNILPVRILHLCPTALAGAPAHLSKILNKYTNCHSVAILEKHFSSSKLNKLKWDYDLVSPNAAQLSKYIHWTDVVHYHRKRFGPPTNGKKTLIQYHSPPRQYKPGLSDADFNKRKLVIAQYHPRYYTDAFIMPNLIDIWDAKHVPIRKAKEKVKIFFSWASEIKGGWSDKGSAQTIQVLEKILLKYGRAVEVVIFNNQPYELCLREKQSAHICIDECVTGSYHLQSLEGCSVGALTINNIDEQTASYLYEVTEQSTHPFFKSNLKELFNHLCHFIENRREMEERGREARVWMEKYWDPRKLIQRYLKVYIDVCLFNSIRSFDVSSIPRSVPQIANVKMKSFSRVAQDQQADVLSKDLLPDYKRSRGVTQGNATATGRSISELHQKYAGQEIYIFGTGPSLFRVNPDHFRDRICFGINYAFEVMPFIDYTFVHVIEPYEAIREKIDNQKLILPETLVRQWYRDPARRVDPNRIPTENKDAYIYPIQNPYLKDISMKHVNLYVDAAIFTWSSTTHSAIHLAAYMGATVIKLIGMDYQHFPNGKVHFASKISEDYGMQDWNANQKHRQGDEWLAVQLNAQNVIVKNLSHDLMLSAKRI